MAVVGLANAPLALWFFAIEQLSFLQGRGHSRGQIPGRDFINYWTGSRLWLEGRVAEAFQQNLYVRDLRAIWGPGLAVHSFSYPPSLLPLIGWLGLLPYGVALALWTLVGLAAVFAAGWPYSRRPLNALLLLLSPAVAVCLDVGQNGLITSALLIGGLRLLDRRPWLGGALIGLVTFKPQLGLLIPLAFLAAGRWKAIGGATLSAAALAVTGALMTAPHGWMLYLTQTVPYQNFMFEHTAGAWNLMTPSVLAAGLTVGAPRAFAMTLQIAVTLACAVAVILRFRRIRLDRRPFEAADILLLIAAGFMAAPYSFNYDMPALALALILAARAQPTLDLSPAWRWGSALLWSAPIWMVLLSGVPALFGSHLPLGPFLTGAGLVLTWIALRRDVSFA